MSLFALVAALATIGLAPPARAGGNEDDAPPTRLVVTPRDSDAVQSRHRPPRDTLDGLRYETIVIGGGSTGGVSVDMSVL
ncbi:hypothetical protein, partial [Zavarzinia sp.]|uniref:hypothetical protein n=1 Tax=Zavarzinia sp. TaxID=2027920 RepID=UPI003BB6CEFC